MSERRMRPYTGTAVTYDFLFCFRFVPATASADNTHAQ